MGTEILHNGTVGLAEIEEQSIYLSLLDKKLLSLAATPGVTLESVISGARGAFPSLVLERLRSLGVERELPRAQPLILSGPNFPGPELHPLDFEWYFTTECADYLATLLAAETGDILCMGAPTVAATLSHRGRKVLLLDNSPLIANRLRNDITALRFIRCDLYDPLPVAASFPAIFFDAPWYPEPASLWLWQASQVTLLGGLIAFSLFPPLLRPGAMAERNQILEQARVLGEVEIQEEALLYETPLFEQAALARCGLRITTDWRRGDLVLIRVARNSDYRRPSTHYLKEQWESFLIGRQVVKLRQPAHGSTDKILAPLTDCPDFVFPTVSLRDPRRSQIDLWTSRNRVARVGRREFVASILSDLAKGISLQGVAARADISSLGAEEQKELLTNLRLVLEETLEENHGATHNRDAIP